MDNSNTLLTYLGKHINEWFSMNQLSKTLQIPYATFYRTVTKMSTLFAMKRIGPSTLISIDKNNPTILAHLTIASHEEMQEFIKTQPKIKQLSKEIYHKDIVLLFGSYANATSTKYSDIDLLIINHKGEKTTSFSKFELIFNTEINPMYISMKEFKQMLCDEEENVAKQALKNHVVLNNPLQFWEAVFDAVRQRKI